MFADNVPCVPLPVEYFLQDKNFISGGIAICNTDGLTVESMHELMLAIEKKGIERELIIITILGTVVPMNEHEHLVLLLFVSQILHLEHFIVSNEVYHSLTLFLHSRRRECGRCHGDSQGNQH